VQVNDDKSANSQFLPAIDVDETTGNVAVSWYDCRNDNGSGPDDTDSKANTDAEIYAGVSTDGGMTFGTNIKVSDGPSNAVAPPNSSGVFDFGDYTNIAFTAGVFHPVWADNSKALPGNDSPMFSMATASITVSQAGVGGGPGGVTAGDSFESNETSDKATNMGVLAPGTASFPGLSIAKHTNGLPDYDWFLWTAGTAGTFSVTTNAVSDKIELHVFTLRGHTLVELARSIAAGPTSRTIAVPAVTGEPLFVEVKGRPLAQGVFGESLYDLSVDLM